MDVSKIDDWKDLKAKVEMDFGLVGLLMLNAGIAVKSGWEDMEYFHKVSLLLPSSSFSACAGLVRRERGYSEI